MAPRFSLSTVFIVVGVLTIPYLLLTQSFVARSAPTPGGAASAATGGGAAQLDLAPYYEAIASAQALLDSIEGGGAAAAAAAAAAPVAAGRAAAGGAAAAAAAPRAAVARAAATAPAARPATRAGAGPRDLVIGLSRGVDTKHLAVFAASLRAVARPAVDLALLIDAPSAADAGFRALVEKYAIDAVAYDTDAIEPARIRAFHPSTFRWPLIHAYLGRKAGAGYRGVLFADVRDTAFQADPFVAILGDERNVFYAFHGVESRTIGECGWNGGWIRDCFGEAKRQKLGKKPIVCSGISVATFAEGAKYAAQMASVVADAAFAPCERNGVDQGVHNVLLHEGQVDGARVVSQRDGLVANLQAKVATVGADFAVANPKKQPVAVVHQYDRFPSLAAHYYATYAAGVPGALPDAAACAAYETRADVDAFKGKCDLSIAGGNQPADCCAKCDKTPSCAAWTLAGSLCYLKTCSSFAGNAKIPGAVSGVKKR